MSRKALLASLAGAMVLGLGAISAQAAPASMSGVRANASELVQKANWRSYRYHRHHHHYRFWRYSHRHHHWR
jgi:hypothetical protein